MRTFEYDRFQRDYWESQQQKGVEQMEMAMDKLFPTLGKTEKQLAEHFKKCEICGQLRGEWEVIGTVIKGRGRSLELRICASCDYWLKQNDYNYDV
jgi:hypothetical protein